MSCLVWTGVENLAPTGIRSLECPAHSKSQYQLFYPSPPCTDVIQQITKLNIILLSLCLPKTTFTVTKILEQKSCLKSELQVIQQLLLFFTWYITSSLSHFYAVIQYFQGVKSVVILKPHFVYNLQVEPLVIQKILPPLLRNFALSKQ